MIYCLLAYSVLLCIVPLLHKGWCKTDAMYWSVRQDAFETFTIQYLGISRQEWNDSFTRAFHESYRKMQEEKLMTKHIIDPQLKEFIEKLKELAKDWTDWDDCDGRCPMHCGRDLQEAIDDYMNQPAPKLEPAKPSNHDLAEYADGEDTDCLTCKYRVEPTWSGYCCKNTNPCDWYSLWEAKDD